MNVIYYYLVAFLLVGKDVDVSLSLHINRISGVDESKEVNILRNTTILHIIYFTHSCDTPISSMLTLIIIYAFIQTLMFGIVVYSVAFPGFTYEEVRGYISSSSILL